MPIKIFAENDEIEAGLDIETVQSIYGKIPLRIEVCEAEKSSLDESYDDDDEPFHVGKSVFFFTKFFFGQTTFFFIIHRGIELIPYRVIIYLITHQGRFKRNL